MCLLHCDVPVDVKIQANADVCLPDTELALNCFYLWISSEHTVSYSSLWSLCISKHSFLVTIIIVILHLHNNILNNKDLYCLHVCAALLFGIQELKVNLLYIRVLPTYITVHS